MTATNSEVISVLKMLIETCKDSENGFRTAAHCVHSAELKKLFDACEHQRGHYAADLTSDLERLGSHAIKSGTIGGALQQGWTRIKAAVTGGDDQALVAELEKSEEAAMRHYEEALKQALPAEVQALVERQFAGVQDTHDRIHALQAAAS